MTEKEFARAVALCVLMAGLAFLAFKEPPQDPGFIPNWPVERNN